MTYQTENHDYSVPEVGQANWGDEWQDTVEGLDRDVALRGALSERPSDPPSGTYFVEDDTSTDTPGRLWRYDGSSWNTSAPGTVHTAIYPTSAQTVPSGTVERVEFQQVEADTIGQADLTNNAIETAVSGIYHVEGQVALSTGIGADTVITLRIAIGNGEDLVTTQRATATDDPVTTTVDGVFQLDQNISLKLEVTHGAGSDVDTVDSYEWSHLSVTKVA